MLFFDYFRVSQKKNIKRSPNGMKPLGRDFWNERDPEDLDPTSRHQPGRHEVGGRAYPPGRALHPRGPPVAHRRTPSSYIYTYVPPNYQIRSQKPNSIAATFCTREIPSWGLFWSSAERGIDHGGLLHQNHSLSGDV